MNLIGQLKQKMNEANLWQKEMEIRRNEYLKVQGSVDTKLYFVEEGSLRIFLLDEEEELTIRFGYEGDFIAALDSFITNKPSDLYIQAIKKSVVKVVDKKTFVDFIQSSETTLKIWQEMLEMLIFTQMERERDILISSPLERYKRVLARSPRLFQEVPHKYIASYLRMTPETLSRLKKS